ncbi:aminoglycoside phosphotransferase family protein [Cytobacillus horneckiae]|uniref:aminoglycoside phosphotransferase family protein n=1 Tax=Cytobacillus horneckiae TaxID=549687 RepID=UPI003D9A8BEE
MNEQELILLLQEQIPDLKIESIAANQKGWDNDIFIVNDAHVFRLPKKPELTKTIEIEKRLLELLHAKNPKMLIPAYEFLYNEKGERIGTSHRYIHGNNLTWIDSSMDLKASAQLLGDFLTKLHQIEVGEARAFGLKEIHNEQYWNNLYQTLEKCVFPFLSKKEQHLVSFIFEHADIHTENKTVIHGDLTAANMIYNDESKKITGIIDFTDAQISDPAFDFAGIYWDFGAAFTMEVLKNYCGTAPTELILKRVGQFYGLQPVFHEWIYTVKKGKHLDPSDGLMKISKRQNL